MPNAPIPPDVTQAKALLKDAKALRQFQVWGALALGMPALALLCMALFDAGFSSDLGIVCFVGLLVASVPPVMKASDLRSKRHQAQRLLDLHRRGTPTPHGAP